METGGARAAEGTGAVAGTTELARNALGLPQILFCIVTGSAPLAAMMFNDPLSGYGIGISVPAGFWLATIAFTLFSVAYVEMARRVTTAGGIYSYMSYGFGRVIGLVSAVGIAAAYMLFAAGVNGVTSYFAQTSILDLSGGFDMDWRIYAFCFIALMFIITYFHVEFVAKLLRRLPRRRGPHPDDLRVRRPRAKEAARTASSGRRSTRPGSSVAARASRARRACSGPASRGWDSRVFLVVGRLRDGPELRRGGPQPEEDDGRGHLHLVHRPRHPLHVLVVDADQRLWLDERRVGLGRRPFLRSRRRCPADRPGSRASGGQLRERLLPGRAGVRGCRHQERLRGAHHHRLLRVLTRLLADGESLPVRDGPRGHPAAAARPNARTAQEPVRRDHGRRTSVS